MYQQVSDTLEALNCDVSIKDFVMYFQASRIYHDTTLIEATDILKPGYNKKHIGSRM